MFDWPALVGAARLPARSRFRRVFVFDTEFSADRARRLACIQWLWFDLRSGEVSEPRIAHAHDDEGASVFRAALADPETLIVGLNTSIDMWVCSGAWGLRREVAEAYAQRRVGDVMLREMFEHFARPAYEGWKKTPPLDPENDAGTGSRGFRVWLKKRWSVGGGGWEPFAVNKLTSKVKGLDKRLRGVGMAAILWRRFGLDVSADKGPDSWRLRYGELIDVPLAEWPDEAVRYALQDAPKTLAPWLSQCSRPERQPFDRPELRWWDRLTSGPDGALLVMHEADRANYAWIMQDISCGIGFEVDHAYAAERRAEYAALEEAALSVLREQRKWRTEDGRATWAPSREQAEQVLGVGVQETKEFAVCPKKGTIKRNPPQEEAIRLYLQSDVPPALTGTGRERAGEYEGLPLRQWPEAAHKYVATSGHSVGYVLGPKSDDAVKLSRDPIEGLQWPAERVRAALEATDSPLLAAKNVGTKAHNQGNVLDRFLRTDAARPDYWPLARTGRVTCRGDLPQNLAQKGGIRECLKPRDGHALLVADYGMIEMVAFAYLRDRIFEQANGLPPGSHRGVLSEAINTGKDVHILLALEILRQPAGWDHDRAVALRKQVEELIDAHGGSKAAAAAANPDLPWGFAAQLLGTDTKKGARDWAKAGNYGGLGGMGDRAFARAQAAKGVIFTLEEAGEIMRALKVQWEMDVYFDAVSRLERAGRKLKCGTLTQVPGSGMVLGGGTYTQTANVWFQGMCAILLERATDRVWRACEGLDGPSPLEGGRIVHLVHDETIAEVPVERAEEALPELQRLMLAPAAELLPGMLVTTSGAILTDRWRKC